MGSVCIEQDMSVYNRICLCNQLGFVCIEQLGSICTDQLGNVCVEEKGNVCIQQLGNMSLEQVLCESPALLPVPTKE